MKKNYSLLLTITCIFGFTLYTQGQGNPKFANRELSNLSSPTAVNTDLLPGSNKKSRLGSSSLQWNYLYVNNLKSSGNSPIAGALGVNGLTSVNNIILNGAVTVNGIHAGIIKSNANGELRSELLKVSDIPSLSGLYLPIKGGTLTGAIKGTNASFSGSATFKNIETENLKITAGRVAAGSIIMSDSNGSASWQLPPATGWSLKGNSGTAAGINFIGTTDDVPLTLEVNGTITGRLETDRTGITFLGFNSGNFNPDWPSYGCTAVGYGALSAGGFTSTATGAEAMVNGSGYYSTSNGYQAGGQGSYNTAMGYRAQVLGSESFTTSIGAMSNMGLDGSAGSFTTAVGYQTLSTGSGQGLTAIGYGAGVTEPGISYSSAIGAGAQVWKSFQVNIGGFIPTSVGGFVNWSTFSDGRYKKNIKENVPGLEFIDSLNPITYSLDVPAIQNKLSVNRKEMKGPEVNMLARAVADQANKKSQTVFTGFTAQEVEAAAKKINYDFSGIDKPRNDPGSFYSLRYGDFIVPLVKAVQELSKINDSLEAANVQLNEQLNQIETYLGMTGNTKNQTTVTLSSTKLFQNTPNPFNNSTTIGYSIPENFNSARIEITDMNGLIIKSFSVTSKGNGQFTLDALQLPSGTYTCRLSVDGVLTDTKKMILIK